MYSYETIGPGICLAVSRAHTFGTDAVLLAHFAHARKNDKMIDLGTGCGIIPFYVAAAGPYPERIDCADIQPDAVEQVRHSIEKNGLQNRIFAQKADIRNISAAYAPCSFSLVTVNPPYKAPNSGHKSARPSAEIARHEVCCTIEDVAAAAAYLLKPAGRLCLCQRPERLADVITALRQYKLEPKRLRFAADSPDKRPFLFLMEAQKGAAPFLQIQPQLNLTENGRMSSDAKEIYANYAKGCEAL